MTDKIYLMLNIALFPFKDLTFHHFEDIRLVAEQAADTGTKKRVKLDKLLDKLYANILLKCKPGSLDEINLILEKYYPCLFHKTFKTNNFEKELYNSYFSIIEGFTKALLSHRDGQMVYKYWKNANDDHFLGPYKELDKVHIFSIISRFIPIDILVASYYSINKITDPMQLDGFYQQINLADAPLHDVLVQGVADNHIHASSAFNFTTLWYFAMNDRLEQKYFKNFKLSQYAVSTQVEEYILTAKTIRVILAQFLYDNFDSQISINSWIKNNPLNNHNDTIIKEIFGFEGNKFLPTSELKEIIEELQKEFTLNDGDRPDDIIFSIFKEDRHIHTYGESILLQYAFRYKEKYKNVSKKSCKCYTQFCNVFFKYISIKNEFYQQITQSSTIKGLNFFKPYFDRATHGFDKKGKDYYIYMLKTLFQNPYLKKVELRISIIDDKYKNQNNVKQILMAYRDILERDYKINDNENIDFPRIGIIYHLIKQADDIEKCWCLYDEDEKTLEDKLHFEQIKKKYIELVSQMLKLRNETPHLANFIVGLDAASLENNTPVQVFSEVFNEARNSDCEPILIKDSDGALIKNQSLFFTFHAGEDFRHINSGLRRIDEVIDYCKFHSGDRIGHGIALGVNVENWVKNNQVVIIPRGEYLDNLLWIWGVYSKNANISPKAYIYLEQQIYSTAKEIFRKTNGLTPAVLYEAYTMRFEKINIQYKKEGTTSLKEEKEYPYESEKFCPEASHKYGIYWDSEKLLHAYHCKFYLKKLTEPIYVNTSDIEQEMASEMQKYVIHKTAMSGIVIEVNPSSNFAIGEISSIFDNQSFNINTTNEKKLENVLVNINSDNPMVFNTNVSNEIAYLYYGMLQRGVGKEAALEWIEKIRKTGIDTSFIRSDISNHEYISSLNSVIATLNGDHH